MINLIKLCSEMSLYNFAKRLSAPEVENKTVFRPWGNYKSIDQQKGFQVKRISVNPGQKLSLQSHKHRSEHWVVVAGKALVTVGDNQLELNVNESVYIEKTQIHRLENIGSNELVLIEVQVGTYLGEDDIIRYEDIYGRA